LDYLRKHWPQFALFGILVASFVLMLFSARQDSLTVDEKVHISAGYLHVWEGDYTFNAEHPPLLNDIGGLFAKIAKPNLPAMSLSDFKGEDQWQFGDLFFYQSGNEVEKIIFWARLPFILLTLGLIYLVFLWAKTLFGEKAGILAAMLTAFCPNVLAHGRLAATDMGVAFFFVLTIWLLRKYIFKSNWQNAVLLGLSLGLVILAKFSGLLILPLVLVGIAVVWFRGIIAVGKPIASSAGQLAGQFLIIIIIPLILIWGVYLFSMRSEMLNLSQTYELSKTFSSQTISDTALKWFLVPFDKFAQGYQLVKEHNLSGHWAYLNGQVSSRGWWYYFPYVLWYKLTLPILILFVLSLFFWRRSKEEFFLIIPPLFFLGLSMTSKIDIGIRHILLVLPFLFIFISRLANTKNLILRPLVALLVIAQIVVGILAYPNYIAYFNQIAGGSKNGLKHLADSNLDWNQNMIRFAQYAQENDIKNIYQLCWDHDSFAYYGIENEVLPASSVQGIVVICAEQLKVTPEGFDLSWVTKNPPDAIIGHTMYIWRFDKKNVK